MTNPRTLGLWAALILLGGLAVVGWMYTRGLTVQQIAVSGAKFADEQQLVDLSGISAGQPMADVSTINTADRVRRHPWVRTASVTRLPTGDVAIRVAERTPVAVHVDDTGSPAAFLDAAGYRMPYVGGQAIDVPIIRGSVRRTAPVIPVAHPALQEFVALLPDLDEAIEALISEVHVQGEDLDLISAPLPTGQSLRVHLGHQDLGARLKRLHAFWHQAAITHQSMTFEWIDLRFDGQVITRART